MQHGPYCFPLRSPDQRIGKDIVVLFGNTVESSSGSMGDVARARSSRFNLLVGGVHDLAAQANP